MKNQTINESKDAYQIAKQSLAYYSSYGSGNKYYLQSCEKSTDCTSSLSCCQGTYTSYDQYLNVKVLRKPTCDRASSTSCQYAMPRYIAPASKTYLSACTKTSECPSSQSCCEGTYTSYNSYYNQRITGSPTCDYASSLSCTYAKPSSYYYSGGNTRPATLGETIISIIVLIANIACCCGCGVK